MIFDMWSIHWPNMFSLDEGKSTIVNCLEQLCCISFFWNVFVFLVVCVSLGGLSRGACCQVGRTSHRQEGAVLSWGPKQLWYFWGDYCWWKKSCTTWDVSNPVNNGTNYLSTSTGEFTGFPPPSTVWNISQSTKWKSKRRRETWVIKPWTPKRKAAWTHDLQVATGQTQWDLPSEGCGCLEVTWFPKVIRQAF